LTFSKLKSAALSHTARHATLHVLLFRSDQTQLHYAKYFFTLHPASIRQSDYCVFSINEVDCCVQLRRGAHCDWVLVITDAKW